jgi:hypothetical protein
MRKIAARRKKTLWEFLGVHRPLFPTLTVAPKSANPLEKLKSFEEVTGPVDRRVRRRAKVDPKSDSSSFAIPIPKHLPELEKWKRIFQMCETVEGGMKEDDVILLGMSVPLT